LPRPRKTLAPPLLLILTTVIGLSQQSRQVDDTVLRNAGKVGGDWPSYGLNLAETRYSPLNQINASNVSRLGLQWSYDVGPGGGFQEATPLVWNDTLYSITNWSIVFAVDAATGKERWRFDPEINQAALRPRICCGVVNRGVAIYQGRIIAPLIDGRLIALDAETGKPVWESRVAYPQENYTITMAPRIAKGKVIIGVAGSEYPVRGFFAAYDANNGQFAWRFYTVPGDPSKPFENAAMKKAAGTWENDWWKLGGGGTVWDGMAYDADADLFYVGTGNGGPWPEELRKSKGKDNLYVCSILAVKPETGALQWYYQAVPGDSWDFDSVQQLVLADLTIKGRPRKVIMQANKNGFYYVLDRVTGAFISGQPFAQVTWAKGLDEKTGRPIINQEAFYGKDQMVKIAPGPGGAHNWAPMSFNPTTGLVYIPTTPGSDFNFVIDSKFPEDFRNDLLNRGVVRLGRGTASEAAAASTPVSLPAIGPSPLEGERGALVAWDPVAQTQRWRAPVGGSTGGGTVTTAGNLVFQALADGRLLAYTADKGEKLLELQTGIRGGMGPPITYQVAGKQYVSVMGGIGTVAPQAGAQAGGGRGAIAGVTPATPPTRPKLLVFVVDGKTPLPASAQ
jgi:quinohemoprotein ethanol dehydrogenase